MVEFVERNLVLYIYHLGNYLILIIQMLYFFNRNKSTGTYFFNIGNVKDQSWSREA
jgi:hypothetical protein